MYIHPNIKVPKGIKDFAFSSSNSAIITGGGDRILRIWLRGNYSEPTGRMKGHLFIIGQIIVHDVRFVPKNELYKNSEKKLSVSYVSRQTRRTQ